MAGTTKPNKPKLQKRNDAYTGFLAISFLAMVGGCVLLYLEFENYEGKNPPKMPNIDVPGALLKNLPGSGGPPPKLEPKVPPDEGEKKEGEKKEMPDKKDPAEKKKEMMFRPPAALPLSPEAVMSEPLKPVEAVQPVGAYGAPVRLPEPVVQIPQAPSIPNTGTGTTGFPASSFPPSSPNAQPIISNVEANISDAPPVPRFTPPMQ